MLVYSFVYSFAYLCVVLSIIKNLPAEIINIFNTFPSNRSPARIKYEPFNLLEISIGEPRRTVKNGEYSMAIVVRLQRRIRQGYPS